MAEAKEIRVPWQELKEFARAFFVRNGCPEGDAEVSADSLVQANLRGVDSHGVHLIPMYLQQFRQGLINPHPNIEVVREAPSVALIDADLSYGTPVSIRAMRMAIVKAKNTGVGWVSICRTAHQGAMYYYPLVAVEQDMAGIAICTSGPNTVPWGSVRCAIGNNPIALGVPSKTRHPLILDMAVSTVAAGWVLHAYERGEPIPEEWALDPAGDPTSDPADFLERGGGMQPVGKYKGSGLSILLEAVVGILAANPLIAPALAGEEWRHRGQGSVMVAIDISAFTDVERFKEEVDRLIDSVKALPRASWASEILVPAEREWRTLAERTRAGVPIHENILRQLREVASELDIPFSH